MEAKLIDYLPEAPARPGAERQDTVMPAGSSLRKWPTVGATDFTGTMGLPREIIRPPRSNPALVLKAKIAKAREKRTHIDTDVTYQSWLQTVHSKDVVAVNFDPAIVEHWQKIVASVRESLRGIITLMDVPASAAIETFAAIQSLYFSHNVPRDRQIADRITTLHRDALAEDEDIAPVSLVQFTQFFLDHPQLSVPKITLTPDGTLRTRWIHGPGNFVAIEFTGEPIVKLVAEIPRDRGLTATHFASEPLTNIVKVAEDLGASFT